LCLLSKIPLFGTALVAACGERLIRVTLRSRSPITLYCRQRSNPTAECHKVKGVYSGIVAA